MRLRELQAVNRQSPEELRSPARTFPPSRAVLAVALLSAAITLLVAPHWTRFQTPEKFPGDMYPSWYALRQLIFHSRNPYSTDVSHEIQLAYYGHPLGENEHQDEQRFVYPLYVVVLVWPLLYPSFRVVRLIAMVGVFGAAMASTLCWLKVMDWRLSREMLAALLLLVACSFPLIEGVMLQQLGLVVGLFIAWAALLIIRRHLLIAGALIAFATIKPQVVLIPLLWLTCWTVGRWRERHRFLIGFASVMLALLTVAQILMPGWMWDFLQGMSRYGRYAFRDPLIVTFAGQTAGWIAIGTICASVGWMIFRHRRVSATEPSFLYMTALTLSTSVACGPALMPAFNQLMLLPAILLLVRSWHDWTLRLTLTALVLLVVPSLIAVFLMAGSPDYLKPIPIAMTLSLPVIVLAALLIRRRALTVA